MTTQIFTVMKKYRFRWEAEEFELTKKDLTLFTKNVRRGETKKRDKTMDKKSWMKDYDNELGVYKYKGVSVISKTEDERNNKAKEYPVESYSDIDFSKPPSKYFYVLTCDTEESVDAEIKRNKEIKKSFITKKKTTLSPKQEKKKRQQDLMNFLSTLVNTGLKKKPLIAKMREKFTKLSSAQVCRFINNQLKLKVIEIDRKYKTKPVIIKGKYWRTN